MVGLPGTVEDEHIETLETLVGLLRHAVGVGAVGDVTEAEAEDNQGVVAKPERHDAGSEVLAMESEPVDPRL